MSYSATAVFGGEADTVSFDGHGEFYFLFFALSLTADLTYVGGTDVNHLIGGSEHVVVSWTSTAANWGKSSAGHLDQVKPLEANTTLIVAGQTITATGGQLIVGDGGAITSNFDTLDTLALGDWI